MLGLDVSSKRKRKPDDYPYHLDYRTRWSDNDVYHHMNNSIYSFLIDSIVNAYLIERCGMDPATSKQVGLVVSTYCDYFGSVSYPSVLDLGLRVVKLGKSSVMYEVGVFEQGDKQVKAVGGSVHVFVESKGRRPARDGMELSMREGLAQILEQEKGAPKL
ncbi:acyl-CoA thioester hydrolase [Capronia epimyces CBS 606.96]|uniref:Acyl-CoA thioester hydrolase n=1 Tax=Capronia epimyces CBS 606.96 TaxID=1182542 RepID=W9Y481_9EURO|nr:acyl-CoA thioester hydrolase [Capronia epimyces CBS 606.96]EXJ84435.1 acyl-CoA thioester hydrolase [Capronia epimyces CBS 606.96]